MFDEWTVSYINNMNEMYDASSRIQHRQGEL